MRRSISVSITAAALLVVLAHADAEAKQGGRKYRNRTRQAATRRARTVASKVVKRDARRISRMRERARLVEPLIVAAAIKYQVDPHAIWVIAYNETRFRWWLVSPKGARGMMQFIPGTARDYGLDNPFNVPASIDAAARYVRRMSDQFGGRLDLVLASYNAGPAAVDAYRRGVRIVCRDGKVINPRAIKTGGVPPYTETRKYVSQGLKVYSRLVNAGVFPQEVLSRTRPSNMPDAASARTLMASFSLDDRELDELGGTQSPMVAAGFSQQTTVAATSQQTVIQPDSSRKVLVSAPASSQIEEVFYDIHSGTRYLVKQGEIVKPLEPVKVEDSSGPEIPAQIKSTVVARSSYYGTRGE
jgi:Transglycosylase SLT domain